MSIRIIVVYTIEDTRVKIIGVRKCPSHRKGIGKHLRVDLNGAGIQNVFWSLDSFLLCLIAL